MGARGPLRLVKDVPVVTGTAAADLPTRAPDKPSAVREDETLSALWDDLMPTLNRSGLVSPADALTLELALRHFVTARRAHDSIGFEVVVDSDADVVKKNPAEAVFRLESDMFLRYAQQLGMTFVSRARTPGKEASDGGNENPFAAL